MMRVGLIIHATSTEGSPSSHQDEQEQQGEQDVVDHCDDEPAVGLGVPLPHLSQDLDLATQDLEDRAARLRELLEERRSCVKSIVAWDSRHEST